jgi:hypothetical protein
MPFKVGNKSHKLTTNGTLASHPSLSLGAMEVKVPSDYFWTDAVKSGREQHNDHFRWCNVALQPAGPTMGRACPYIRRRSSRKVLSRSSTSLSGHFQFTFERYCETSVKGGPPSTAQRTKSGTLQLIAFFFVSTWNDMECNTMTSFCI